MSTSEVFTTITNTRFHYSVNMKNQYKSIITSKYIFYFPSYSQSSEYIYNSSMITPSKDQVPQNIHEVSASFSSQMLKMQQVLTAADLKQYTNLHKKYRFYLAKYSKFHKNMLKLSEQYQTLDQKILDSKPVQQQLKSIEFVEMLSTEIMGKLTFFGFLVTAGKTKKKQYEQYIHKLKKKINKQKTLFFALKKKQAQMTGQIKQKRQQRIRLHFESKFKGLNRKNGTRLNFNMKQQIKKRQSLDFDLQVSSKLKAFEAMKHKIQELQEQKQNNIFHFTSLGMKSQMQKVKHKKIQQVHSFGKLGQSQEPLTERLILTDQLFEKFDKKDQRRKEFNLFTFKEIFNLIVKHNKANLILKLLTKHQEKFFKTSSFLT